MIRMHLRATRALLFLLVLGGVVESANAGDASIMISVVGMPANTDPASLEATEQCVSGLMRALRNPDLDVESVATVSEAQLRAQLLDPPRENFMQWPANVLERPVVAGSYWRTYLLVSCQADEADLAVFAPGGGSGRMIVSHFRLRAAITRQVRNALAAAIATFAEANTPI